MTLNAQPAQVALTRLDLAFAAFFRRVKAGAESQGFPALGLTIDLRASGSSAMATGSGSHQERIGDMVSWVVRHWRHGCAR
jgi:hypothetical protein